MKDSEMPCKPEAGRPNYALLCWHGTAAWRLIPAGPSRSGGHVMTSLYPCKHRHGTTFCSASRDATGKLKVRVACASCVVKAGLNPKGVYDKVVCCVCGGKGMVEPARESAKARPAHDRLLLVVLPVLLLSVVFFAF